MQHKTPTVCYSINGELNIKVLRGPHKDLYLWIAERPLTFEGDYSRFLANLHRHSAVRIAQDSTHIYHDETGFYISMMSTNSRVEVEITEEEALAILELVSAAFDRDNYSEYPDDHRPQLSQDLESGRMVTTL